MKCDAIQVISRPETTLAAVGAALELLQPSGLVSVLAYTGHPGVWGMLPLGSCCYAAGIVITVQHIVHLTGRVMLPSIGCCDSLLRMQYACLIMAAKVESLSREQARQSDMPSAGGREEYEAVRDLGSRQHPDEFTVFEHRILSRPNAPVLLLFWKRINS